MKQHEQRGRGGTGDAQPGASRVPGKQTLVEQAYGQAAGVIQRKAAGVPATTADSALQTVADSSGAPVDAGIRSRVENTTGAQLGDARVHTGDASSKAAAALGARAFTAGNDIHFGAGEYQPGSSEGQLLIAHELVHTVQQRGGAGVQQKGQVSEPGDAAEVEADRVAEAVVRGGAVCLITQTSAPIARQPVAALFSPNLGVKKTTLTTPSGTYEVTHGLITKPDTTTSPPFGEYSLKITMKPNASTGGHDIAFIQTWRMREPSGAPVTKEKGADVTATEVNRMDTKSGMVLDRANPTRDKTPFFGMLKEGGALKERSTAHKGKHGGDDVMLADTPGVNDPDNMEFTATATDMTDGTPLDAIGWGFKYDSSKRTYTEETPAIVKAGSERMAGRDRAYKKWNDKVATPGSGIDAVKMPFDPAAIAEGVAKAMDGFGTDEAALRSLLLGVTDADRRLRVRACFKLETGRELKEALQDEMSGDDLKGLEDWLK
jgi:hypothetical protein